MDDKDKKLIQDIKTWDISEGKKNHLITCLKKDRKQKEAFMRLSKDERLKAVCRDHIKDAFDHGLQLAVWVSDGTLRPTAKILKDEIKRLRTGLTWSLKDAKVLPLGK
jgi:hypothetical protein